MRSDTSYCFSRLTQCALGVAASWLSFLLGLGYQLPQSLKHAFFSCDFREILA